MSVKNTFINIPNDLAIALNNSLLTLVPTLKLIIAGTYKFLLTIGLSTILSNLFCCSNQSTPLYLIIFSMFRFSKTLGVKS